MGRTIASITQTWQQEEAALKRFQRALRKEDQMLLDELLVLSRLHLAEASYASNLYPMDMYLIAILLEVYKQLKTIQKRTNQGKQSDRLSSKNEARFIQLLNETLTPPVQPSVQLETSAEELSEPAITVSYSDFEEAP